MKINVNSTFNFESSTVFFQTSPSNKLYTAEIKQAAGVIIRENTVLVSVYFYYLFWESQVGHNSNISNNKRKENIIDKFLTYIVDIDYKPKKSISDWRETFINEIRQRTMKAEWKILNQTIKMFHQNKQNQFRKPLFRTLIISLISKGKTIAYICNSSG